MTIYHTLKLIMEYHIKSGKINFWERTKLKEIWEYMGGAIGENPTDEEMENTLQIWQVRLVREVGERFLIKKATRL